jgi:uncharacterized protein (DUF486 family)
MNNIENFNPFYAHGAVTESKTHGSPLVRKFAMSWEPPTPKNYVVLIVVVCVLFFLGAIFQTLAWYHDVDGNSDSFLIAFSISMAFVFFEYIFVLPANSIGAKTLNLVQLGILSEIMGWIVFILYVKFIRKDKIDPKCWIGLGIMMIGVFVAYM